MKRLFNFGRSNSRATSLSESPDNSRLSADYQLKDKDLSQLHKAASDGDLVKLTQLIVKKKKDVNQLDKKDRSALHIASAAGHYDVVRFLLENRAELNLYDAHKRTALMKAVQGHHEDCVHILLDHGTDPNLEDLNGNTALHLAANIPSVSMAGLLLKHPIDINASNQDGLTPLALAVCEGHTEMAEFLLKEGADVDGVDNDNRSPLMIAAGHGFSPMIQLLLRNDGDVSLTDNKGRSAKDYADMNGHHSCFNLVTEYETLKRDEASSLDRDQSEKKQLSASQRSEGGCSQEGKESYGDENETSSEEEDFKDDTLSVTSESVYGGQRREMSQELLDYLRDVADWDSDSTSSEDDVPEDEGLDSEPRATGEKEMINEQEMFKEEVEEMSSVNAEMEEHQSSHLDFDDEKKDDSLLEESENTKLEQLLNKLEGHVDENTKLLEALGVFDGDDSEDDSDSDHSLAKAQHEPSAGTEETSEPLVHGAMSPGSVSPQWSYNSTPQSDSLSWGSDCSSFEWSDTDIDESQTTPRKKKPLNLGRRKRRPSAQVETSLREEETEPETAPGIDSSPTLPRASSFPMTSTDLSSFEVSSDDDSDLSEDMNGQEEEDEEEQQERQPDIDAATSIPETDPQNNKETDLRIETSPEKEGAVKHTVDSDLEETESENEEELHTVGVEMEEFNSSNSLWDEKNTDSQKGMARFMEEEEEEQYQPEKENMKLALTSLELQPKTLVDDVKQLEEDHSGAQMLLVQEHSPPTPDEDLLNSPVREQQELQRQNSDRDLLEHTFTLQEQIKILRGDLERAQANSSLKEMMKLQEENEALKEQLEDAQREAKAHSDALIQTVFNCKSQLTALKSELDSTKTHLATAVKDVERCSAEKADAEKALLREKEETERLKDRLIADSAIHRETVSNLSLNLSKAESDGNSLKNELHSVTLQLTEKGLLLDVVQKEKEQLEAQVESLKKALQAEKEQLSKTEASHEAMQQRVTLVDERNRELASQTVTLQNQVCRSQEEKSQREETVRQLQQELTHAQSRLSQSEASLEVNTRCRSSLEEENVRVRKDLERLREKLTQSEDQNEQVVKRFNSLNSSWNEKEKDLTSSIQRLQEALSDSSSADATIKHLEEAVQKLELKNKTLKEDFHMQLERETLKCHELETGTRRAQKKAEEMSELKNTLDDRLEQEMKRNAELHQEKSRLTTLMKKAKKRLRDQDLEMEQKYQDKLQELRKQMELTQREQGQAKERTRQERQKLERRIQELETEASCSRSTLLDSLSQQKSMGMELERYKSMYSEELRQRQSLATKLEKSNARLTETYSQLVCERSKSLLDGSWGDSPLNGILSGKPGTEPESRVVPVQLGQTNAQ